MLSIFLMLSFCIFAQAPQSFQYQAVVRDASGTAMVNHSVNFQISIISGSISGTVEYIETQTASTNAFGVVTLSVGTGTTSENFAGINWSNALHFVKIEADPTGGSSYLDMGTTQLLSVPYALNSLKSDQATNADYATNSNHAINADYSTVAGTANYVGGTGINVTGSTITNTSPDQTVALTQAGATTVTGTYPNFTISSTDLNSGTPGGLNKTVQFNNAGLFSGNSNFIWDNSNERLGVGLSNPSGRMVIQGSATALATEPLFEVKNAAGQTVFVVYQDSVNVFVNDDAIQSNRGGFAVSGRNNSKAITHNFLKVTPDNTRIHTGDPITGFGVSDINGGPTASYMQMTPDNYFIGHESGLNINPGSGGLYNNFFGYQSGKFTTFGSSNNAIGYQSLFKNIGGNYNVSNGYQALYNNTYGYYNVANGYQALYSNTYGNSNVANGYQALYFDTTGSNNVANGYQALYYNNANYNVANGYQALFSNTSGTYNTSSGYQTLYSNTTGSWNSANGMNALYSNQSGYYNVANGYQALYSNTTGHSNTANGYATMFSNTIGNNNTATGIESLYSNTEGYNNTATGLGALNFNTIGSENSAHGVGSLFHNITGNNNTAIGNFAFFNGTTFSNSTAIGFQSDITASNQVSLGSNTVTSFYCMGAFAATTALASNMYVSSFGQIMRSTSSKRYKKNIENLTINTEDIYKLRPVSYISILDNKPYFGLIAEEVAEIIPGLAEFTKEKDVIKDSKSEKLIPDAVQYSMLSVLLLNEVQKHKKEITELKEKNDEIQKLNQNLLKRIETIEKTISK